MTIREWTTALVVGVLAFAPAGHAPAQEPDREVEQVKAYLTGKVQFYYRVGGILYGTHHLVDIEYKPSGRFALAVDTAKVTVLDNIQRGGWRDAGTWEVVRVGRQVGVRHVCDGGHQEFFPVQVLPDGDVRLLAAGFPRGTETGWMVQGWKYRFEISVASASITLAPR